MKAGMSRTLAFLALGAFACNSSTPAADDAAPLVTAPDAAPITGPATYTHYVTSSLMVGTSKSQADSYAFDLNGDHVVDDKLGEGLAQLSGQGLSADSALAQAVTAGQIVLLQSLHATSLTDSPSASLRALVGDPQTNPVLTGGGSFTVSASSPLDSILDGKIAAGQFAGGPGTIVVPLALGTGVVTVHLIAAHAQADCTATGCTNGKLGGAVLKTELDATLAPAVATILDAQMVADGCDQPGPPATCTLADVGILFLFDANHDGRITTAEVLASSTWNNLTAPDMDLLDAAGNPGHDGVKESTSFAMGYTAASAVFTAPGE
jgi:hypothetical protein